MCGILYFIIACLGILVGYEAGLTGATECYQCDSWKDSGCDEDYTVNINLTICGQQSTSSYWRGDRDREREIASISASPTTCIKEVTMFIDPPVRSQYDPYNRFNRPWVRRRCGFIIQQGYRSGRDLLDDCDETEEVINGVRGIKKTCSCSTDGCNTAAALKSNEIITLFIGIICLRYGIRALQ